MASAGGGNRLSNIASRRQKGRIVSVEEERADRLAGNLDVLPIPSRCEAMLGRWWAASQFATMKRRQLLEPDWA